MIIKKAVILLSGGLDSAVCAGLARESGYDLIALTFLYGQRHACELTAAKRIAAYYHADEHLYSEVDSRLFHGSAYAGSLTSSASSADDVTAAYEGVPSTYVPARNLLFLSFAAAVAETRGAEAAYIGANCVDYSGYPDCRPAFLEAFERTANLALASSVSGGHGLRVAAPLLRLSKADIVREGLRLRAPLELTHSCYFPDQTGAACGRCDSCRLRLAGFAEAGAKDPVRYADDA